MAAIDWLLLVSYLLLTLVLGLWLARRNSGEEDYFVAGRRLSGWLAGASMAATTFSIDTPLYVAGLVGSPRPGGQLGVVELWFGPRGHGCCLRTPLAPQRGVHRRRLHRAALWRSGGGLVARHQGFPAGRAGELHRHRLCLPRPPQGGGSAGAWCRVNTCSTGTDGHGLAPGSGRGSACDEFTPWPVGSGPSWSPIWSSSCWRWSGALAVADGCPPCRRRDDSVVGATAGAAAGRSCSLWCPGPWDDAVASTGCRAAGISSPDVHWPTSLCSGGVSAAAMAGGEFIQRMLATRDEQQARLAGWVFLVVNYLRAQLALDRGRPWRPLCCLPIWR